ncbi:MAG: hypothetical protein REI64_09100 [Pedobacter sp.]|uniref:hypothetical protein n=1 Tax=Pedobacter sp. TaxID=1411316 RepID=UPI002808C6CF|nr:hypothetical protein [Pedobacter sp.]MDQ8004942.1 hypothetical protein [Pedobacter sp.]
MENKAPQHENDPKDQKKVIDGPGNMNDRPQTHDGISDQGTTAEEVSGEEQQRTNADEREIPQLNPGRNDVENQEPTDFDIDESTD